MSKYEDGSNDGFEVYPVGVVNSVNDLEVVSRIQRSHRHDQMRDKLMWISFALLIGSLVVATAIGLYDGSFNEVDVVWKAGALPLGWMLKSYFGKG
jgi:hypothetical protein